LVGNFGDGTINAYNLSTDTFAGRLDDGNGNPLAIDGLWGLTFGNGASSGTANFQDPNRLYFTAGLNGEADGLLGSLQPVPEPAGLPLACIGFASVAVGAVRRSLMRKKQ
ncbi:MAG: TIGR03118 family protein, partial [Acidobacteriaceae bacterium]|nr:TIGR03118 family protein [Acidobacteriaceae bacterium]